MSRVLWSVQTLLAVVFLFSGGMKLVMPPDVLAQMLPLPDLVVRLIGLAESLGAIGLILPGLLRIRPALTSLAAAGLVLLMTGATVLTPAFTGQAASAVLPLVLGLLAAFVLFGRSRQVGYKVTIGWRPTTS